MGNLRCIDFFMMLDNTTREMVKTNTINNEGVYYFNIIMNDYCGSMCEFLATSFVWSETEQGYYFWDKLCGDYKNKVPKPNFVRFNCKIEEFC